MIGAAAVGPVCVVALLACAMPGGAGTRDLLDRSNRFLDQRFPPAELTPSVVLADSFESPESTAKDWETKGLTVEPSRDHATDGQHSLKAVFAGPASFLRYRRGTQGWGGPVTVEETALGMRALWYDELRIDLFNPGGQVTLAVSVGGEARLEYPLPTGAIALSIPTAQLRKDAYRGSTVPQSLKFALAGISSPTALFLDNVRWVGPGLGKNLIRYAKCFDFGVPQCTRPFFLTIEPTTGYTRERGFGWEKPTTSPPQPWPPVLGGELTGRRPDDELLRDFVSRAQTPLLLDLPDGRYRLHLVEHGIGFYEVSPCFYDLTVRVSDGQPTLLRRRAATYEECRRFEYGLDQTDWEPNEDLWRKYRGHLVRPLELDFEAKGGHVKLDFATRPGGFENLSFLIVYPVDQAAAIEPELAALWQDLRYRFLEAFAPVPRPIAEKMRLPGLHDEMDPETRKRRWSDLAPAEQETRQGYLLFSRDGIEEVYPDTVPTRAECAAEHAAFGPPGEIESFAVGLLALRDLKGVRLEVGDFVGPGGAKIGKERADLRVVNCIYRMTGQQSHGDWRPLVVPWHLVKRPSVDVPEGTCRRFWINVDIPGETPPGQYVARAALEGAGLPRHEFPLRLEVLPFPLDPLPAGIEQSMAMAWPHWWTQLDDRLAFFIRTYVIYSDPRNFKKPENAPFEPLYNEARKSLVERRKAELDLAHRYGLNLVYFATNYIDPPVLEELKSHYAGKRSIAWFRGEDPQDKTVAEMAAKRAFLHRYGTPCLEDQTEAGVRKRGLETKLPVILNMNTGTLGWSDVQQEAGIYRFEAGFLLWRLGAQGGTFGPWYMPWRDPYNPFDGHVSEWGDFADPASAGGPPASGAGAPPASRQDACSTLNPTLILEGLREGIQDYRCLAMLERLVREKQGTPAAQEGQECLRKLRERIQPQASHYFQKIGRQGGWDNTWTQRETAWKGKDYREHRREIAARIVALLRAQAP